MNEYLALFFIYFTGVVLLILVQKHHPFFNEKEDAMAFIIAWPVFSPFVLFILVILLLHKMISWLGEKIL